MKAESLDFKRNEFFENVWNHSVDEFQESFDERRSLNNEEISFLKSLVESANTCDSDEAFGASIKDLVKKQPVFLALLLQLIGLTRNKIITDLKAVSMSEKRKESFPGKFESLCSSEKGWDLAGPYLAKKSLKVFKGLNKNNISSAAQSLNQATWSGWIRQERAKRSGHEGESRLANVLYECGIPFVPTERIDNPLCKDIQINKVSFDLVVPDPKSPRVVFKATVHTSNIGQYGESKDHLEIDEARRMIDSSYSTSKKPVLCALIDGIGFTSNRAGLDGVLSKSDVFCQFNTIWKAFVVCAYFLNINGYIKMTLVEKEKHSDFLKSFNFFDKVITEDISVSFKRKIRAGSVEILL